MPPRNELEPRPDQIDPARRLSQAQPRRADRSVSCMRCGQRLFFPSVRSSGMNIVCCGRCGARTRIPSMQTAVHRIVTAVIYLSALAAVVFVVLRHG